MKSDEQIIERRKKKTFEKIPTKQCDKKKSTFGHRSKKKNKILKIYERYQKKKNRKKKKHVE